MERECGALPSDPRLRRVSAVTLSAATLVTRAGWFNFEGFGRPFEGWAREPCQWASEPGHNPGRCRACQAAAWITAGRALTRAGALRKARRKLAELKARR